MIHKNITVMFNTNREHNMKITKKYISGEITGKPNGNKEMFSHAKDLIMISGSIPINPHDICKHLPINSTFIDYMRVCVSELVLHADIIVMLPGWIHSKGARIEFIIALLMGIKIEFLSKAALK